MGAATSSIASASDHIDHVRTQLPYAVTVGGVGILLGTLPAGFGFPWWIALPLGAAVLLVVHGYLGKSVAGLEIDGEETSATAAGA